MNSIILDVKETHFTRFVRVLPEPAIATKRPLPYDPRYLEVKVKTPLTGKEFKAFLDAKCKGLDCSLVTPII